MERPLSELLKLWRAERPDEWIMDEFIREAKRMEEQLQNTSSNSDYAKKVYGVDLDRYNCEYCNLIGENDMCEAKDGEWVRYDDIKHLL